MRAAIPVLQAKHDGIVRRGAANRMCPTRLATDCRCSAPPLVGSVPYVALSSAVATSPERQDRCAARLDRSDGANHGAHHDWPEPHLSSRGGVATHYPCCGCVIDPPYPATRSGTRLSPYPVLDQLQPAPVAETGSKAADQSDRLVGGAQEQRAGIRADHPPSNVPTTAWPATVPKSSESCPHSVAIGDCLRLAPS
jgi:hypothetical protein